MMTAKQKRESVKNNYDIIAKQYSAEFGKYIEDLDVYEEFERHLKLGSRILDLGAGSGRTYAYFSKRGFDYIGLDFSKEMKDCAYKLHGEFPYMLDDMVNVKKHFEKNSIDAVFAVYSLFHLPMEDLKQVLANVSYILKDEGVLLFSYQVGQGEEMADEPYLQEKGKKVLYMSYQTNEEIKDLLNKFSFKEVYRKEKVETLDSAINNNSSTTVFVIAKKNFR